MEPDAPADEPNWLRRHQFLVVSLLGSATLFTLLVAAGLALDAGPRTPRAATLPPTPVPSPSISFLPRPQGYCLTADSGPFGPHPGLRKVQRTPTAVLQQAIAAHLAGDTRWRLSSSDRNTRTYSTYVSDDIRFRLIIRRVTAPTPGWRFGSTSWTTCPAPFPTPATTAATR